MALIEINKNPSAKEMRWFGALVALFFGIIGGVSLWHGAAMATAQKLWAVGVGLGAIYYIIPPIRRAMYLGWMYLAFPIGWVISHTILAIAYYLVFTPIGLVMRIIGRDPMHRRFEPNRPTYWEPHPGSDSSRYFRQF